MSFDELPPDSEPTRTGKEVTPPSEQEASVQDAPPAGTTRRRRATKTGTDAASTAPSAETKQPRTRRTNPKTRTVERRENEDQATIDERTAQRDIAPPSDPSALPPESLETAVSSEVTAAAEPTPRTRRSRRNATKAADGEASQPAGAAADAAPPDAAPRKRPSRTRKTERAAPDELPPPLEADPPVIATEAEATTIEAETPPPPRKPRKSSTRSKRTAGPAVTQPDAENVNQAASNLEAPPPDSLEIISEELVFERAPTVLDKNEPPLSEADTVPPVIEPATETLRTGRHRRNRDRRPKRENLRENRIETPEPEALEPGAVLAEAPPAIVQKVIDRSVGAHLVTRNGLPQIHINGVVYPPVMFFGNMEGSVNHQRVISEVRRAARAGVHLHSALIELPCPLSEATEALDEVDRILRAILDADPKGFVMPRIVFIPARGWRREYPTDITTYADGVTGDPSLTSERFWREAEHSLAALIGHLGEYEWGGRIFGYHLERGEWFQPADQGFDRSMANREAFRDWLREKYKNSLVALRAAWYDGNVQFHTAEIPPVTAKPNPQRAFFETRRERRIIDFYAFTSESTAQRLARLASATKRATDDQALVSVCYGYTFEFGHGFSGHLALGQLLECPDIDLVCGPPSYRDRKPGGAASLPSPVDSAPLHGKLWLSEDDTKTYLSPTHPEPDDFNPRLGDRFQTEQAHMRAMGRALATATGVSFMDLWGEGWMDDDSLWERISAFAERYQAFLSIQDTRRSPEVVAIVDEKSLLHVQRGEGFYRKLTNGLRDVLQRSGVAYGTYLQSDLLSPEFPTDAKLYVFLTPYRLTTEQRSAIKEKLQGGNRTLAWLYAPGSCEERPQLGGAMEESASGAVGISLRQQEWNSEVGSRVIDPRHPITERLNSREIGIRERLNPSFYVEDSEATVLAEYQASGLPSLAVKRCGNWQSVFVGEPTLTVDLFRGICKFAGVHLWTAPGEDAVFIGNGWITIHASRDGHRALRLPTPTGLYDYTERRLVAEELREHRFFMRAGTTRIFCSGALEWLRSLGLPNLVMESGPARTVSPPPIVPDSPPVPAPLPAEQEAPEGLSEDMQTLQAVLNMDLSQLENLPLDTTDEFEIAHPMRGSTPEMADAEARLAALLPDADMMAQGRRRRRRGGRGRGRRRTESGEPEIGGGDAPSSSDPGGNAVTGTSGADEAEHDETEAESQRVEVIDVDYASSGPDFAGEEQPEPVSAEETIEPVYNGAAETSEESL